MHVYDFITDEFQYQLKAKARQGNDRFEQVLIRYRILFFEQLRRCIPTAQARFLPASLQKTEAVKDRLGELHDVLLQEAINAEKLFDEVINGYSLFLRGKHFLSTLKYQDLLESYQLLADEDTDNLHLFFRGTDRKGGAKEKFHHIPYNTRHKVQNQRFSFSGIPFLYLGASVADIYFEFNQPDLDAHQPFIASFAVRPSVPSETPARRRKLFNITNLLFNYINAHIRSLVDPEDKAVSAPFADADLVIYFRKLILAQVCTFPRLEDGSPFCEEYVIPQLFTEALRMHTYDGIVFSSTTFSEQKIEFDSQFPNLRFKDNIVWFTQYADHQLYDEELLNQFEITTKDMKGYGKTTCQELQQLIQEQLTTLEHRIVQPKPTTHAYLRKATDAIEQRLHLYKGMKINQRPYWQTHAGKLELIHTHAYLDFLMDQCD